MKTKLLLPFILTAFTLSACSFTAKTGDISSQSKQDTGADTSVPSTQNAESESAVKESAESESISESNSESVEAETEKALSAPEISKEELFEKILSAAKGLNSFHIEKDTVYDISGEDAKTLVRNTGSDAYYIEGDFERSYSIAKTSLKGQDSVTETYIIRQEGNNFTYYEKEQDGAWETANEEGAFIIPNYFGISSLFTAYPDFWLLTTEGDKYILTFDTSDVESMDVNMIFDIFSHTDSRLYMNVLMISYEMAESLKFSVAINSENFYIESYNLGFTHDNETDTVSAVFSDFNEIKPESITAPQ